METNQGISPRTPPRQLTLHEYRRQCRLEELTPPPSEADGGRRLKRKRGAVNLSIDMPSPTPGAGSSKAQTPRFWSFPITPATDQDEFEELSHLAPPSSSRPVNPYSFASVFKPSFGEQHLLISSKGSDIAPQRSVNRMNDTPSYPLLPMSIVADRAQALRPRKRLPHPNEPLDDKYGLISLRRVTALSSDSMTATDTSSLSLSRFPEPPHSHVDSPPQESVEFEQSSKANSTTVLHMRGVSFDVVNPHGSLALQNIETPLDRDSELQEYFHFEPPRSNASATESVNMTPSQTRIDTGNSSSKEMSTPPRPIFPNFQSAYNSIRKGQQRLPSVQHLPQPPLTPQARLLPSEFEDPRPIESVITPSSSPAITRPKSATPSFIQRFSRAFHRKTKSTDTIERKISFRGSSRMQSRIQPESYHISASTNNLYSRATGTRPSLQRSARSEAEMLVHYYDTDSILDSSVLQPDSTSFDHNENELTLSSPTNLQAESYESNKKGTNEEPEVVATSKSLRENQCNLFLDKDTQDVQPDSTIGSILEQYHYLHEEPDLSRDHAQNEAFMDSMRRLRPTNSGLSQFEFGFDTDCNPKMGMTDRINDQTYNLIRQATARVLGGTPGAGPIRSLPPTPTYQLAPPRATFLERSFSNHSAESMSWISYGDTRNLLSDSQQLEPTTELGRDASEGNLSQRASDSPMHSPITVVRTPVLNPELQEPQLLGSTMSSPPSVQETAAMTRRSNFDLQIEEDLKHLSGVSTMSGISNISGSIFVVNNTGMPSEEDFGRIQDNGRASAFLETSSNSRGNRGLRRESFQNGPDQPLIAAFLPENIKPGIWRLSKADRQLLINHNESQEILTQEQVPLFDPDLIADENEEEGNDLDWETVAESRNGVSGYKTESSSLGDWTSQNTLGSLRNISVHPGDSRYHHGYRYYSRPNSSRPILLPSYDFRFGAGFPNRNALSSPEPILYTTYNHPTPLPVHLHPFSNSPPQIGSGSPPHRPTIKTFRVESEIREGTPALPAFFWPGVNLSVVHENATEGSIRDSKRHRCHRTRSRALEPIDSDKLNSVKNSSSGWLSANAGPSSSLEVELSATYGNSKEDLKSEILCPFTPSSPGFIRILREGDPRLPSTPLHPDNSFAMVSPLGPLANITGTPNGTGMRWLGSSIVGSSSPYVPNTTPPAHASYGSPPTPPSSPPVLASFVSRAGEHSSPLARYHEKSSTHAKFAKTARSQRESYYSSTRAEQHVRPYVESQSKLLELRLAQKVESVTTPASPGIDDTKSCKYSHKGIGNQLRQPLLPMVEKDPLAILRETPRSRSLRATRVPSSVATSTRSKKEFLSWMFLLIAILFPPLTLLYGLSKLDVAIFSFTKGEIEHFGQRQKKAALFGIPLSLGIWALIIILATLH